MEKLHFSLTPINNPASSRIKEVENDENSSVEAIG